MFKSFSKRLNQKSALVAVLGLLLLVVFVPHITYANLLEEFLWTLVNLLFGWLVWISGMFLDYTINHMVIGFGKLFAESGLGLTIDTLWVTVRDIFNLTFIFGLVFIGLRMIFGSDSNTKKMLISIILAALLVNFSLFITKFVVDFSNISTVQLVNSFPKDADGAVSISGEFMRLMGLTSVLDFSSKSGADFEKLRGGGSFGYIFGTMFLYIITAFVFFAGSFLLIIRFVVLNIYMVLSPIMFIGWVFPSMSKYSTEYWSGFLSRCFVAPAYILMIYFSAKVLANFSITGGGPKSLSAMWTKEAPASFIQVFPPFILTAVFLIAAVVVAQKMGANGSGAVMSIGNKMVGKAKSYGKRAAGGATAGTAAFAGRQLAGRAGNRLANNPSFNKWAAESRTGKALLKTTKGVANSSYDVRNIGGVGKAFGLGGGNDKGYLARKEEADKKRREREIKFNNSLDKIDIKSEAGKKALEENTKNLVDEEKTKVGSELHKADGTHTTNTAAVASTTAAVATKEAEIATEKSAKEAEIAKLEAELKDAKKYQTKDQSDEIEKKLNTTKAELDKIEETSGLADLKNDVATAQKNFATSQTVLKGVMDSLKTKAESATIYANQIAYAKTIQGRADTWNKVPIIRNNHSFGRRNKDVADHMKNYYGEYGQKAQANILKTETNAKDNLNRDKLLKELQKSLKDEKEKSAEAKPAPAA